MFVVRSQRVFWSRVRCTVTRAFGNVFSVLSQRFFFSYVCFVTNVFLVMCLLYGHKDFFVMCLLFCHKGFFGHVFVM